MADGTIASVIPLPQPQKIADTALTQRPRSGPPAKTGAERQRAYKQRLRAAKAAQLPAVVPEVLVPNFGNGSSAAQNAPELVITNPSNARLDRSERGRDGLSSSRLALRAAALGLAVVGLFMNAVYARSLGSSDLSGWLFLALGLCADCAALGRGLQPGRRDQGGGLGDLGGGVRLRPPRERRLCLDQHQRRHPGAVEPRHPGRHRRVIGPR